MNMRLNILDREILIIIKKEKREHNRKKHHLWNEIRKYEESRRTLWDRYWL